MDWSKYQALSEQWKRDGLWYTEAVKEYIAGMDAAKGKRKEEPPKDPRLEYAEEVFKIVRLANQASRIDELRKHFPPAYEPFLKWYPEDAWIDSILFIDEKRICCRRFSYYGAPKTILIEGNQAKELEKIVHVGRSPDRRYYAYAYLHGVEIRDGWDGPLVGQLYWPVDLESLSVEKEVSPVAVAPPISALHVFPDGKRLLLLNTSGLFVIGEKEARRIYPDEKIIKEQYGELGESNLEIYLDMEHVAFSPDGKYIAVGEQGSSHYVLDESFQLVGKVDPISEYAHFALFSADGKKVAFNSCHIYWGGTIGCDLSDLIAGIEKKVELDSEMRVYAGVSREDHIIIGGAYGYISANTWEGRKLWNRFLGGTITGMDISPDGTKLAVGNAAGILYLLDLEVEEDSPYVIGTSKHRECRRWLFLNEGTPLIW